MNQLKHIKQLGILILLFPIALSAQEVPKAFFKAAKKADIFEIQVFLKNGTEINAIDKSGSTALMYASESGSAELVLYLLNKGADYRIKDYENENALTKAKKDGARDIIDVLEFAKAKAENSLASYSEYETNHKYGRFIKDAKFAIETFEYESAIDNLKSGENDIESYLNFKSQYPNSEYLQAFTQKIKLLLANFESADSDLLISEIRLLIYPFTIRQLYTDCTKKVKKNPNTLSISTIKYTGDGNITWSADSLGEQSRQRTMPIDREQKQSIYASSKVGDYINVALVDGLTRMSDIEQGSGAFKNAQLILRLSHPEPDSYRIIPFNKITFFNKHKEAVKILIYIDGNFIDITTK